jgi:3-hydroxy-3-methylglutaryl CoA synthase/uncharacterized OB-fold protein
MADRFVKSIGGYLPLLRLSRASAVSALKWSGLSGLRDGRRAVAGWDEDALTMAVEAGRIALSDSAPPSGVIFASTSAHFFERPQAPLMAAALGLSEDLRSNDCAGSRRCGVSALLQALDGRGDWLVAVGEKRPTKAGSATQLAYGDGAAACLVSDEGSARLLAARGFTRDFVDVYASREHPTPYVAEERFVRDVAITEIVAPVVSRLLREAGVDAASIGYVAFNEPASGIYKTLAGQVGLKAANLGSELAAAAGDLGAAHSLFAFAMALERAKVGEKILLIGFGSGCDAALFEKCADTPGAASANVALRRGRHFTDYIRFASLSSTIDLDWGVRSEFEQKTAATVLGRYGGDMMGFIAGRDSRGNVQFPKSPIPVSPEASGPESLDDVRLADGAARIVSITADRLNYTPDPPFLFGLTQFENGARVMMEFTEADAGDLAVGDAVTMRFRIKSIDRRRGFRTYFWKAAPIERPQLES